MIGHSSNKLTLSNKFNNNQNDYKEIFVKYILGKKLNLKELYMLNNNTINIKNFDSIIQCFETKYNYSLDIKSLEKPQNLLNDTKLNAKLKQKIKDMIGIKTGGNKKTISFPIENQIDTNPIIKLNRKTISFPIENEIDTNTIIKPNKRTISFPITYLNQ